MRKLDRSEDAQIQFRANVTFKLRFRIPSLDIQNGIFETILFIDPTALTVRLSLDRPLDRTQNRQQLTTFFAQWKES